MSQHSLVRSSFASPLIAAPAAMLVLDKLSDSYNLKI
jgi:hypothetical protein